MPRVLVIDDDVLFSRLLKEHLTHEGFEVVTASRSAEGLEQALKNPPDLILLDLMLPDETGYQTCGKLRQNLQTRSVPIIMMTSAARLPSQHAIGRMMGANAVMVKPFNLVDAGDRVHSFLGSKPKARKNSQEPPAPVESAGPLRLVFVPSSAALFDDSAR